MLRRLAFLVVIALLAINPVVTYAQTPVVVVDTFMVTDGASHPTELSTCQAFTTGGAIYLPEGTPETHALITFEGYPPDANSTGHVSQILNGMGTMLYDEGLGVWEWEGLLPPAALGPGELWVSVGDNVFYNTTTTFTLTVSAEGFEPVIRDFTLVNDCAAPVDEPTTVSASTWLVDTEGNQGEENSLVTSNGFTTGVAYYHDSNVPLPVTLTLEGYSPDMLPEIHQGSNVLGVPVYDPSTGIYTWEGELISGGATEMWVNVTTNGFYSETKQFIWTVDSAEITEPYITTFTVTNPLDPPVEPEVHVFFLPYVVSAPAAPVDKDPLVTLDVSASDGVTDSRSTGVLHTTRSFAINFAAYPKSSAPVGEVTISVTSFTGLEPTTFNLSTGLVGTPSYASGTWSWTGSLKAGLAPSEFWINVPAGKLTGSRIFIVTLSQPGYKDVTSGVTVASP